MRSVLNVLGQALRRFGAPVGIVDAAEVQIGENGETLGIGAFAKRLDRLAQLLPRTAAEIDQHLEVQLVHLADNLVQLRAGKVGAMMAVDVDDGELGPGHEMLFGHQRRARRPLLDGQLLGDDDDGEACQQRE